jgi:hypothetical protein
VIHFALYRRSDPEIVRITASETSDQKNHWMVVGTGSAVSPVSLLLICASWRHDRSDDHAPFDGLKHSRLSSGLVSRPCPPGSFIARNESGRVARMLRPVSQTTGISAVPHTQEVTGRCYCRVDTEISGYLGEAPVPGPGNGAIGRRRDLQIAPW